jgi:AraC family transcriptional regulator
MEQTRLIGRGSQGQAIPAIPTVPQYDSAPLQWSGFVLERHWMPPGSIAANVMVEHCLAISRSPRPVPIRWRVNRQRITGVMEPDRAYFRSAGDELACDWDTPLDAIFLAVSRDAVTLVYDTLGQKSPPLHTDLSGGLVDTDLVQTVLTLNILVQEDRSDPLLEQSLLLACGLRLASLYSPTPMAKTRAHGSGSLSRRKLILIDDYILAHIAGPLTLEDLAAAAGLSTFHLCRAFHDTCGISLWYYVRACRIAWARQLMARFPDMPLSGVAQACGFGSYSQFYQTFRQFSSATPSAFRKTIPGGL